MKWIKRLFITLFMAIFLAIGGAAALVFSISRDLPQIMTVNDYQPRMVSEVYARGGEKIGEFFREKRVIVPYDQIPKHVVHAFLAAEDDQFFEHRGINPVAIFRATLANLRAGKATQGGSTITQQVAKTILLTSEKTLDRKLKDIMLALQMEKNLKKEEILYLYLNQIYFGGGAWGVATAADVYFHKKLSELTLGEAAMLAGLPQAPSRYSPLINPKSAKERQLYVLRRMSEVGYITAEQAHAEADKSVAVNVREEMAPASAFYVETLRQLLVQRLGESAVLDQGLKIYTGLDFSKQVAAQKAIQDRLRELDKRQGFRGAQSNLQKVDDFAAFLLKTRNNLIDKVTSMRVIAADGTIPVKGPLDLERQKSQKIGSPNLPDYIKVDQIVDAVVTKIDDTLGIAYVRFAENQGVLDIEDMRWAKPFNTDKGTDGQINKPSEALKFGDLIRIRIIEDQFPEEILRKRTAITKTKKRAKDPQPVGPPLPSLTGYVRVALDQDPLVEGALLSLDQKTQEVIAMVGGYDFARNQFNRSIMAARQTGSLFKVFVYAAALDKGYTAATPIIDAPVVFEEKIAKEGQGTADEIKRWKPDNHSRKFGGDILFRNALLQSLNVPTVKIIEDIGIDWPAEYARRLGLFSPINMDMSMALGSSSVTLYEMTKAFAQIARLGRRIRPLMVHKVLDRNGKTILTDLSLDERFHKELEVLERDFDQRRKNYLEQQGQSTEAALATEKDQKVADATAATPAEVPPPAQAERAPAQADAGKTPTAPNQPLAQPHKPVSKYPPLYFSDSDQLLKPTTAFVMLDILHAAVNEPGGTAGAARALERPAAGKTGTTNSYADAWFVGFTPQIVTGVWVGFDEEKSIGQGEVGGRAALPAWLDYMKFAHQQEPVMSFSAPAGIVFANIDKETGFVAGAQSKRVVRQAFTEGTEPSKNRKAPSRQDETDFLKEELSL